MPSGGSLTRARDTVGGWLALLPPRVRGAHQSGREARQSDRCEMGDDTKSAVVWPETAARLSQPGCLNDRSDFLAAVTCPGGTAAWQGDACALFHVPHTVYPHYLEGFLDRAGETRLASSLKPPLPQTRLERMGLFVHASPLSTLAQARAHTPKTATFRLELSALGDCVLH